MEIGLYNAKYPFRKMLNFLLNYCRNTDPNYISFAIIPIGLLTAFTYLLAPIFPFLYWFAVIFLIARMVVGTLDGMVEENFNKTTPNGTILNRLTPEVADMILLAGIICASPGYYLLGIAALIISWGISYAGLIGLAGGKKIRSVGPVGQTDRLVALLVFSILQFFSLHDHWNFDFMKLFLWWVIIGGIVTITLRCYQTLTSNE
jgi:phosphatidylglycerophosphate synthase